MVKANLYFRASKLQECDELTRIADSWDNMKELGGEVHKPDYIYKCLTEGDLPPVPNASKENYRLRTIFEKSSNTIVGYYDLYHGYPDNNTVWVSMVIIDKAHRGKGYGREVVDIIKAEMRTAGFKRICLGVYLKNWPALRFWTKEGFNKIIGIYGDKVYGEHKYSTIGLEYQL